MLSSGLCPLVCRFLFLANSPAKLLHFLQFAKLFFMVRKEFNCLTCCISTNATKESLRAFLPPLANLQYIDKQILPSLHPRTEDKEPGNLTFAIL